MALRNLRFNDDKILRTKAKDVKEITPRILELLDDMSETMYKNNGIGLAAPQIGVLRRVITVDIGEGLIELLNPHIIEEKGVQKGLEGCLSLPKKSGYVERPEYIRVRGLNREGVSKEYEATGLLAVVFCHEIDHLNGVLFIDKATEVIEDEEIELNNEVEVN